MVRRGWSQVEVPNGWVQLIRGPRPKSVQWPRATKEGKPKQVIPQRQLRTPTASSRSPEEVAKQARKRVGQLQVAMHALDLTDPARPALEEALKKARGLATLPSLEEQVQSTEQVGGGGEEVVACTEKRDSLRTEMVSAEERLARLKDEVGRGGQDGHPVPNPQFHIPPEQNMENDWDALMKFAEEFGWSKEANPRAAK